MAPKYLFPILMLLVWLMLSACGNITQPQVEQTAISPLPTATQKIVQQIVSPIIKVTSTSTPIPKKVKPTSKSLPTSSPTLSPTPTVRPSPIPSPTFVPLPPLDETLQTIVFATNNEQGSEIWRVQVDEQGKNTKPAELLKHISSPGYTAVYIYGLYPSPNGQWAAVDWAWGTAGYVDILNIKTGQITPLFGEVNIDQRVTFLDWSPDGQNMLAMGGVSNPDLGNSAWLINVDTHSYHAVDIKQKHSIPTILGASFSPDGKKIVYTHSRLQAEIWLLNLEDATQQLLHQDPYARIEDVLWSFDGNYIAFTQWVIDDSFPPPVSKFGVGQLYLMKTDGSEKKLLSSIVIHFKNQIFRPVWSADSRQIAFVKSENPKSERKLNQMVSNIYLVDIVNNQVSQLTHYQGKKVIKPMWHPNGLEVTFLMGEPGVDSPLQPQIITISEGKVQPLIINLASQKTLINFNINTSMVWLP